MANYWDAVNNVIQQADILLIILDARLVDETRNIEIEQKVKNSNKPLIYVITKCDLVDDKKDVEKYKKSLKPCVFISAIKYYGVNLLRDKILIEAKRNNISLPAKVGVLGYPNVGKSSLINAMIGRGSASTSMMSGHTKGVQRIKGDNSITFLDSPGVIPFNEKDSTKHSIIGTTDFTRTKDPDLVVMEIMKKFPGKIEDYYDVKPNENFEQTIEDIAIKKNIIKKKNKPDIDKMARIILKDWQTGKIINLN
ncbi:GTPase [Nanoarchaeota archaeon]